MQKLPDVHDVAAAIGWPVIDWPGNCYGVACMIVQYKVIDGRPRYGHFRGEVPPLENGQTVFRHHKRPPRLVAGTRQRRLRGWPGGVCLDPRGAQDRREGAHNRHGPVVA